MLSVIIPMYNEEKIIGETVSSLRAFLHSRMPYEIILVDDGSTDGTLAAARPLCGENVRLTGYEKNRGKGYAMRFAAEQAKGDLILFIDSDLSYGLQAIADATAMQAQGGADMVIGSRHLLKRAYANYPALRRAASAVFSACVQAILKLHCSDTQCGFKLYTKDAAKSIFPQCRVDGFAADLEILTLADRLGLRVDLIPVAVANHGETKVSMLRDPLIMLRDAFLIKKLHGVGHDGKEKKIDRRSS